MAIGSIETIYKGRAKLQHARSCYTGWISYLSPGPLQYSTVIANSVLCKIWPQESCDSLRPLEPVMVFSGVVQGISMSSVLLPVLVRCLPDS